MRTGYFAPLGLEEPLKSELNGIAHQYGRLLLAEGPPQPSHWAQNIWFDPQTISFTSISDAAKKLRSLQKLWSFYPYALAGKGRLISEQLPFFSPKPLSFPSQLQNSSTCKTALLSQIETPLPRLPSRVGRRQRVQKSEAFPSQSGLKSSIFHCREVLQLPLPSKIPEAPLGSWMLLDEKTILASPRCSSPFALGEIHFQESKVPPSRAYLKLWETFTRIGRMPQPHEACLEIGASPGSWTWALQQLGAKVFAADRAPLDPAIAKLPQVSFIKGDAFKLGPSDFSKLDWIFSDIVCYPEKLLEWIYRWPLSDINFVCTIKFQGSEGYGIVREFEKIEGSQIFHLFHNKHELTWVKLRSI